MVTSIFASIVSCMICVCSRHVTARGMGQCPQVKVLLWFCPFSRVIDFESLMQIRILPPPPSNGKFYPVKTIPPATCLVCTIKDPLASFVFSSFFSVVLSLCRLRPVYTAPFPIQLPRVALELELIHKGASTKYTNIIEF